MRVLVRADLDASRPVGLGLVTALTAAGARVFCDPVRVVTPLPAPVAQALTRTVNAPVDLFIDLGEPGQLGTGDDVPAAVKVAWTVWHATGVSTMRGRSDLRQRLGRYDAVLGYDTVTTDALTPYVKGVSATVHPGYDSRLFTPVQRRWDGPLRVCMVGSLDARHDMLTGIRAFTELRSRKEDFDASLSIKTLTSTPPAPEQFVPGVQVIDEMWPASVLRDFYADHHIMLALTRGGSDLPPVEFAATGGAVLATNWATHTQWLSSSYAYPLRVFVEPLRTRSDTSRWCQVDVEHLKDTLLLAHRNREALFRCGYSAGDLMPQICGWPGVLDRLFTTLSARLPAVGQQLLHTWRVAVESTRLPAGVRE